MTAAASSGARRSTAQELAIAGLSRLSTCDWPGRLVATVFLQGCPWRCTYCHNVELLDMATPGQVSWESVLAFLDRRRGLLDAVVFSGGEPTRQEGLIAAMREVRERGFAVGIHTAGVYPRRLGEALPLLDWVGLDVKALPSRYTAVTGVEASAPKAWESLSLVLSSGVAHEVRITVDPAIHTREHLVELVNGLLGRGAQQVVLQEARTLGTRPGFAPAAMDLAGLVASFPDAVTARRA
ncbi:MAG TPA: anaerobic ribonucleoside-triphosphate reductase activating protein [Arachnia sp.]|nr:anaerobic ribonucleoside-triphosphate reductase activating protein [Arachnia sp.]HMT86624.1 anaerobic ribonucleoside-triphosphate reductase activating protein [Arachnia sp.]